jgi:hypothetical protein
MYLLPMKISTPTTTASLGFLVALSFYLWNSKSLNQTTRLEPPLSVPVANTLVPEPSDPLTSQTPVLPAAPLLQPVTDIPAAPLLAPGPFPGTPPKIAFSSSPLGWELQLKEARAKAADGTSAARAILSMLSYLPEEALETAVEQALEKLPDTAWSTTAGPVLANPSSHMRVLSVLFADLMERPQTVSLPALGGLAQDSSHPFASFAFDNLKLFLGEDLQLAGPEIDAAINAKPASANPESRQ